MSELEQRVATLEQELLEMKRTHGEILDAKGLSEHVFRGELSPWSIYKLVKEKGMPHIKIEGNRLFFSRSNVIEWMQEHQQVNRPIRRIN